MNFQISFLLFIIFKVVFVLISDVRHISHSLIAQRGGQNIVVLPVYHEDWQWQFSYSLEKDLQCLIVIMKGK
jgi:hypothetical protein